MDSNTLKRKRSRNVTPFIIFVFIITVAVYRYVSRIMRTRELVTAVEQADVRAVTRLLDAGADADKYTAFNDDDGNVRDWISDVTAGETRMGPPLLVIAATSENVDIVRALLSYGADINYRTPRGDTALSLAKTSNAGRNKTTIIAILRHAATTQTRQAHH